MGLWKLVLRAWSGSLAMKSRSFSPCLMEVQAQPQPGHPHSQHTISFPKDSLSASSPHPSFSGSYGVRPHLGL